MLTRGWLGKEMRALGRLASVSPALRLLADAVAHIAVAFHDHSLLLGRGRAGATRWFSVLRDLNTIRKTMPLRFTLAAAGIDITAAQGWRQPEITGTVVERPRFGHGFTITGSAVCADCVMRTGIHCAVFTLLEDCDPATRCLTTRCLTGSASSLTPTSSNSEASSNRRCGGIVGTALECPSRTFQSV